MTTETVEKSAAELVADALLARTSDASVLSMLKADMKAVDDVSSTGGYDNALEVAKAINLSQAELALWLEPSARSKPDAIGTAINQRHDEIAPNHGPSRMKVIAQALQLAIDAMPLDEAKEASEGNRTKDDNGNVRKYPLVPKASERGDNKKNAPLTGNAAYDELYKRYSNAATPNDDGSMKEPELAAIYRQACQCAVSDDDIPQSDIDRLGSPRDVRIARVRQMSADKQARFVNAGRFRSILFLPLIEDELTNFMKVSGKSVGSVWAEAAAKARSAHAEYMKSLSTTRKGKGIDTAELVSDMRSKAREYLLGKSGTKVSTAKDAAEKVDDASAAMFANARKLHDLGAVADDFSDQLLSALAHGLFNDGQFLTAIGVIMDCASLKTKELERRKKEEEDRAAKAERDEQERMASEQRRVEREQKKADALKKAQEEIEAKAKLAKDQAAIDESNAAKEAAAKVNPAPSPDELTAEQKLEAKRARKSA